MATLADVLHGATARVLPLLMGLPLAARLIDTPPSSLAEATAIVTLAWLTVVVRPLVLALGFTAALFAARARVSAEAARSRRRAALAVAVLVVGQLVGSLALQAAGPALGVPLDLALGALAALLVYAAGRGAAVMRAAT